MLQARHITAEPELIQPRVRPKVINMPVRPPGAPQVVCDPGTQASRTERAADVNIESLPKPHLSESSHPDGPLRRAAQDERICAGFRRQGWCDLRIDHRGERYASHLLLDQSLSNPAMGQPLT